MIDYDTKAGPLRDIDTLETIAAWKDDLTERVRRARLRDELIGLSAEEIITLSAEAAEFNRLCEVLKGVTHARVV